VLAGREALEVVLGTEVFDRELAPGRRQVVLSNAPDLDAER
jgi:hypothetical protein